MESTDNGIEVDGLVREFKKGPRAVDGIDLRVSPGEIYGVLGPNGAGKSTTVHMLTTLLPPTSGTARVAGHDIVAEGPAVRDAIGVALQEAALDPFLTAREHMRLQAGMHGIPRAEARRLGDRLIARVASTWRWRSSTAPGSCFSTSRRPDSTSRAGRRSGTRWRGSRAMRE